MFFLPILKFFCHVLTAFETNQSNGPEGSDHSNPLQTDASACYQGPAQSPVVIRSLKVAALRRPGRRRALTDQRSLYPQVQGQK